MTQLPASAPPTLYFIGVSTGQSASRRMFPAWAHLLGLDSAQLVGVDLPLDAPAEHYRAIVRQIAQTPHIRGALVTSHKLNLLAAARPLFDQISPDALLGEEVSCIYKRPWPVPSQAATPEQLIAHAVDPSVCYQSLQDLAPPGYWRRRPSELVCLGAGGTAAALLGGLLTRGMPQAGVAPADVAPPDLPRRVTFVDIQPERLAHLQRLAQRFPDSGLEVVLACHTVPEQNDALLAQLPPGSLVLNATGLGKDRPGSPLSPAAVFPLEGLVWELNYRGALDFLRQAQAQALARHLRVLDGWNYFLRGWAMVVETVFERPIAEQDFARLQAAAKQSRAG